MIDIDATLITSHSQQDGAAGTFKGSFGFHPLLAYLDQTREALAGVLRPGNAGANTASDHIDVIELALEQLPRDIVEQTPIVVRTDSAAATHELTDELRAARISFLMGFDLTGPCAWRSAACPKRRGVWRSARTANSARARGWPRSPSASSWPASARASAEDRVRAAKQTGLENLPFRDFDHNQVWPELSLIAQDLIARTQLLALDGDLKPCEPKTLRYRLPHTAARLAFHARRRHPAPATQQALGRRAGRRLRAPAGAPTARALNRADAFDDDHALGPPSESHRCPSPP